MAFLLCKEGSVTMQMDGNDFELKKDDLYIYPAFSKTIITKCSDDFAAIGSAAESRYSFTLLKSMPGDSQCMAHIRFKPAGIPAGGCRTGDRKAVQPCC